MADCNIEFQTFLDTIQLSKSKVVDLRRSRDALKEKIINYYKGKNITPPDFCGQGSFKVKTGIYQSDEDYDIDLGIYIKHLPEKKVDWDKTEILHDEIYEAVDGHTDTSPEDKTSCIRVQYKKEYHVDLAIYGEEDGVIFLARKGNEQWEENNPKLFTAWFYEKLNLYNEQFRSVCKYIKKWSYYNGWIDTISGFLITILTGDHFKKYNDRDDISLLETLKKIVAHLEKNREILRPVEPKKNMINSLSDKDIDNMINHFKNFRDLAENAVSTDNKENAHDIWRQLFGDDFPKYKEKQDGNSSKVYTITRENKPWGE